MAVKNAPPSIKAAGSANFRNKLVQPGTIVLVGCLVSIGIAVSARIGFGASLLESSFWAVTFLGLGLGAASFLRMSQELNRMRGSLDHTRKQMATTARVLAETLEQAENLANVSREVAALPPRHASNEAVADSHGSANSNRVHLEGLANVARAQVILANKSEADIGVLSSLIRDIAEAVTDQEREIEELRRETADAARSAREAIFALQKPPVSNLAPNSRPLAANFSDRLVSGADPRMLQPSVLANEPPADRLLVSQLEDAFANDGFSVALQPVVTLPQRKVRLYEATLQLKGETIPRSANVFRKAALAAGSAARYDHLLIARALRIIRYFRKREKDISVFCEVTGAMLVANTAFDQLVNELSREPEVSKSLVIAFSQDTHSQLRQNEKDLLKTLSETGVKQAVAGLAHMRRDPLMLSNEGIRFVTIDAARLLGASSAGLPGLDVHVADLAGLFARRNIEMIVQNISGEQEIIDLLDMEIPLVQGKFLGEARAINPELLEAVQSKPDITPQVAPVPPAVQRQPLRNFLRRA